MSRFNVRRGAPWMVVFAMAALTACGGEDPVAPGGGGGGGGGTTFTVTTNVSVGNSFFSPANIQVSPGATVTWTYASGSFSHNVTFAAASITDIPNQTSGAHTATMPSAAGDYTYQCTNHGGMTGTVRVQ